MKMYVPFYYEKTGQIEVEANSVQEARKKAQEILDNMSWKECGMLAECVDDSAQIAYDGIVLDENSNLLPELTKQQQQELCGIYNNSDLEALNYMYRFLKDMYESPLLTLLDNLRALNLLTKLGNGDRDYTYEEAELYYNGKQTLLNYFGIQIVNGDAVIKP